MREYRRLMRWYPNLWRVQHEEFMLDTLRERLESPGGLPGPSGEKWSIRLHGAGERLTLTLASNLSVAALAVFAVVGVQRVVAQPGGIWTWLVLLLSTAVGPILLSLAAFALLRIVGVLSPPAAVGAGCLSILAWSLAWLSALSWSTGFDEADAGVSRTLIGQLFVPLFLVLGLAGAAAVALTWAALMVHTRPVWARQLVVVAVASVSVVPVGLGAISPAPGLVVSLLLLVMIQRMRGGSRVAALEPSFQARQFTGEIRARIVGLAASGGLLGFLCIVFAFTGSLWGSVSLDGTQAMNLGLAAGSLVAIPVALAFGVVVTRRGAWFWQPTWAAIAALVAVSAGQFAGAGHPLQWPLILASAASLGIGAAFVVSRMLPGGPVIRSIATVAISVAVAASAGIYTVILLPFFTPLAAVTLVAWVIRTRPASSVEPLLPAGV